MNYQVGDEVKVVRSARRVLIGKIGIVIEVDGDTIRIDFSKHSEVIREIIFLNFSDYRMHKNRVELNKRVSKEEQVIRKIHELNARFERYQKFKRAQNASV